MGNKKVYILRVSNDDGTVVSQIVAPTLELVKSEANLIMDLDYGLMEDELEWEYDGISSYYAEDRKFHQYEITTGSYIEYVEYV